MSLSTRAIDRLFERLAATYGDAWTRQWREVPIADVKSAWAHELAPFADRLQAVAWALENLPDNAPNAIQFRNLCRQAPGPDLKPLPVPKADPELVAKTLREIQQLSAGLQMQRNEQDIPGMPPRNPKAWARKLLERHENGDPRPAACVAMAKAALRERQEQAHEL